MGDLVAWLILRGTLQKKYSKSCEHGDSDPIIDSFQFGIPVSFPSRYPTHLHPPLKAAMGRMD